MIFQYLVNKTQQLFIKLKLLNTTLCNVNYFQEIENQHQQQENYQFEQIKCKPLNKTIKCDQIDKLQIKKFKKKAGRKQQHTIEQDKIKTLTNITLQSITAIYMGVTQSLQRIETFYNYHKLIQNNHSQLKAQYQLYFGHHFQIYANKFNQKDLFVKHTINFNEPKQMINFINEVKQIKNKNNHNIPFNILYPLNIFLKENRTSLFENLPVTCGNTDNQVIVIHKWLGKSLFDFVQETQQPLNQESVWFILNELSKSLEILEENNHASFHVMPQNIWCNSNQNWFLYDGRFVIGTQGIQQFYKRKLKNGHFLSEDIKKKIQTNTLITNNDSLHEDIYCLGYCVIFMLTGIHPKQMPKQSHERQKVVNEILQSLGQRSSQSTIPKNLQIQQNLQYYSGTRYSIQVISLIKNLIKPDPKRRFTIRHIRSYLKSKQQQIFMKEQQQWSRSQQDKSSSRKRKNQLQQNIFETWGPKKYQRIKSPQKNFQKRLATQNSEGESNFTSIRTLKKEPIPQKMIVINTKEMNKPAFNLIENDGKNNKLNSSGQFTPIRKIQQSSSYSNRFNFKSGQKIPSKKYTQSNVCYNISTEIRRMNSPQRYKNQLSYASPERDSNSSINTRAYQQNGSFNFEKFHDSNLSDKPRLFMYSPSHHQQHAFLSPNKIKVTYQSPQKQNF